MSITERYQFPTDTRLGIQHITNWESVFDQYVEETCGAAAEIMIKPNITSHAIFLDVFNSYNNDNPIKGFINSCAGLSRFAEALFIHGSDGGRDLVCS